MITIHTDGGCKKPGGVGAWAYTIDWPDGRYIEASGTEASTTNNRMEMMAVLMALKAPRSIRLNCFTTYVVSCDVPFRSVSARIFSTARLMLFFDGR